MSRLLADEDFPLPSVDRLRAEGHDVAAVREDASGADDVEVLARAVAEQRILLTLDRHHGRLIYREGRPAPPAVVYFRSGARTPEWPAIIVARLLAEDALPIEGTFVTVHRGLARRRPLP